MSQIEQSEGYSPEAGLSEEEGCREQVYKRRVERLTSQSVEGKWTEEENLKYILFMDYHYKIFVSKEKRKSERIFKTLSDFLVTRTPRQCRSHFQKIINKFKKLRKVRLHYQEQLGTAVYEQRLEELSKQLKEQKVKVEESERTCTASFGEVAVQTDPMQLSLSDLSNLELMKLMNLLNECQKIQLPQWMPSLNRPQMR